MKRPVARRLRGHWPRYVGMALVGVLLAGVMGVGGWSWWQASHRGPLEEAVRLLPSESKRVFFTDWEKVRARLGVRAVKAGTPAPQEAARLSERSYAANLADSSVVDDSVVDMQGTLGFSALSAQWEAYAQSPRGSALVLRMSDGTDFGDIERRLKAADFRQPRTDSGVWRGGVDVVAVLGDGTLPTEVQYVSLLADRGLVVAAQDLRSARRAAKAARGESTTLADVDGVDSLIATAPPGLSTTVWARDFACEDLSMAQTDAASQRQARGLVTRAGGVNPLTGLAMSMTSSGTVAVTARFESADQAKRDARTRTKLLLGPAPGRAASLAETYRVQSVRREGNEVTWQLQPRRGAKASIAELNEGPVLFATC